MLETLGETHCGTSSGRCSKEFNGEMLEKYWTELGVREELEKVVTELSKEMESLAGSTTKRLDH